MSIFGDVLNELGWQQGFQIPVANLENQKLQEELAKLTLQRAKTKTATENARIGYENLENHLKYLEEEKTENQKLITVHKQQLETENTKLKSAQIESERISKEIQQFDRKLAEIQERQQIKDQQLQKSLKKFEKLKSESKWDIEAIKVWDESIRKREDDNELIKKFSRDDEIKFNELEAKRLRLEKEYTQRNETIKELISEIHKYETTVERTGQIIKEQFNEKENLIKCWKDSVKILQQRNNEIKTLQQTIIETKQLIVQQNEKLDEQNQFYRNQIRNNAELELENQRLNTMNSKLRQHFNDLAQETLLLDSEADTMRRLVTTTANQLDRQRKELKLINHNIEMKQQYIEKYQQIVDKLKIKLDKVEKSSITSAERYEHLEKLLNYELKQEVFLIKNLESLQLTYFKDNEEYKKQLDNGKTIEYELNGMIMAMKNIRKRNRDVEKDIEKTKELIYEIEFKIDQIQGKIMKIESTDSDKDDDELLIELKKLESKFNELSQMRNLLNDQVTKIRNDLRRLQQQITTNHDKIIKLESKLNTQLLNIEGGEKQLSIHRLKHQELQVDESILTLRINHLEKLLKNTNISIYSSQKYRLNLEQVMMERLLEINKNRDLLQMKRRNLLEDKSRLKIDLNERQSRLEQFKKKYDIVLMSLGVDNEGKPLSITYIKIKTAQEKYMLQQEGDELDKKIRKAEREIVAMENTLKIVNQSNAAFKNSLSTVEEHDDEMNEMKMLNHEILRMNDCLRQCRQEIIDIKDEIGDLKNNYQLLTTQNLEYREKLQELEEQHNKLWKDYEIKQEKILRTQNCLKNTKKKLINNKISLETYEQDFQTRQLRECNNKVLENLTDLQNEYEEITPLIKNYESIHSIRLSGKSSDTSSSSTTPTTTSSHSTCSNRSKSSSNKKLPSMASNISVKKVQLTLNI